MTKEPPLALSQESRMERESIKNTNAPARKQQDCRSERFFHVREKASRFLLFSFYPIDLLGRGEPPESAEKRRKRQRTAASIAVTEGDFISRRQGRMKVQWRRSV